MTIFTRLLLVLGAYALFCIPVYSQTAPYFKNYPYNWQFINPAAMDRNMMKSEDNYNLFQIQNRNEWIGFEGAPTTTFATWEYRPGPKGQDEGTFWNNSRWGGGAFYDQTDAFRQYGAKGNFAYIIRLNGPRFPIKMTTHCIHIGVSAGVQHHSLNSGRIKNTLADPDDPLIDGYKSRGIMDFGFGIMYRSARRFYFGISAPEMTRHYTWFKKGEDLPNNTRFQQFFLTTGRFFEIGKTLKMEEDPIGSTAAFLLEPALNIRYTPNIRYINFFGDRSRISADLNIRLYGFNRFFAGVGHNTNGTSSLELGYSSRLSSIKAKEKGYRAGIVSNFPTRGKNPALGTSVEAFFTYFLVYKRSSK